MNINHEVCYDELTIKLVIFHGCQITGGNSIVMKQLANDENMWPHPMFEKHMGLRYLIGELPIPSPNNMVPIWASCNLVNPMQ